MTMPALGESVTEGTVTRWLKQEGEQVEVDEPLLEVSTDKVDTEIPSPAAGVLTKILVAEDETVEVGAQLAVIGGGGGGAAPAASPQQEAPAEAPEPSRRPAAGGPPRPEAGAPAPAPAGAERRQPGRAEGPSGRPHRPRLPRGSARPAATGAAATSRPLVRRLAAEKGVDLRSVRHRRRRADPQAGRARRRRAGGRTRAGGAAGAAGRTPSPGRHARHVRARPDGEAVPAARGHRPAHGRVAAGQRAADHGRRGRRHAHRRLRQQAKKDFEAREGVKLSFLPFFAKAAVEALKAHPSVNSSIDQEAGTVTYHDTENLGIAVDTERGLLVPVIHEAGDLSLGGIARKIADLAERTRTNKITPDELGGGTFTLTNTGSRGALFDTPIINQPQVAILGVGSVVKRPVVVQDPDLGEVIAVRSMVYLALTYDHRIVDGADAARFLTTVRERLEAGQFQGELGLGLNFAIRAPASPGP